MQNVRSHPSVVILSFQLARLLEVGLILKWTRFPGFREAFNPGEINWNHDADQFMQQMGHPDGGANSTGLHSMNFENFDMVISDTQLEILALTLGINLSSTENLAAHVQTQLPDRLRAFTKKVMRKPLVKHRAPETQPCTWNMFLKRSPSMMASLEKHSPWGMASGGSVFRHQTVQYIAWHIRTPDGESARSYRPEVHQYVIQEPSSDVCPTYFEAMKDALQLAEMCNSSIPSHVEDELVYISSNSKQMAKNCTLEAAKYGVVMAHVDLGLDTRDAHTAHSRHPEETALGAFLDFLFLMDSTLIVRTGSSFSGTVVSIKGMNCHKQTYDSLPNRPLIFCLPSDC